MMARRVRVCRAAHCQRHTAVEDADDRQGAVEEGAPPFGRGALWRRADHRAQHFHRNERLGRQPLSLRQAAIPLSAQPVGRQQRDRGCCLPPDARRIRTQRSGLESCPHGGRFHIWCGELDEIALTHTEELLLPRREHLARILSLSEHPRLAPRSAPLLGRRRIGRAARLQLRVGREDLGGRRDLLLVQIGVCFRRLPREARLIDGPLLPRRTLCQSSLRMNTALGSSLVGGFQIYDLALELEDFRTHLPQLAQRHLEA